ncbi:unnamed protein product [Photorhabdus laumondii subsp. laumondii TTO1]|uniref:Photorhabdus luminescens subsp. laumondii TTO1 complete genome segment 1/17 n=1 Tax=Photorhabdus laumondii subsp. laumondii (strain DSM 15139 / CIP 105565 / TT01) TaxID=243265 RepID=Q7N9Q8_PHOLL|nr:unnamed protein product [Photorhabdus laumondii subsp. laumondii TTO1]
MSCLALLYLCFTIKKSFCFYRHPLTLAFTDEECLNNINERQFTRAIWFRNDYQLVSEKLRYSGLKAHSEYD